MKTQRGETKEGRGGKENFSEAKGGATRRERRKRIKGEKGKEKGVVKE